MNPQTRFLIRWALCIGILSWVLFRSDLSMIAAQLRHVHLGWLLVALGLCLGNTWFTATQLHAGVVDMGLSFTRRRLLEIVWISGFYSVVVPGGILAGAVASFYKIGSPEARWMEAGTLVVLLRILNTFLLVLLGLPGALLDVHLTDPRLSACLIALALGLGAGLLPLFFPNAMEQRVRDLFVEAPGRIRQLVDRLADVLLLCGRIGRQGVLQILLHGVALNACLLLAWVFLARACAIPLPWHVLLWISALQGVLQLVPFTVAGLGVREVTLVAILGPYGIPAEQALALSALILLVLLLNTLVGGILEALEKGTTS